MELDNIYDQHFGVGVETESHECSIEEESLSTSEMSDDSGDQSSMATDTARLAQHIGSMSQDSKSSDGQIDDQEPVELCRQCTCIKECLKRISSDIIDTHVMNVQEMTSSEKDLYVMGTLNNISTDNKRTR